MIKSKWLFLFSIFTLLSSSFSMARGRSTDTPTAVGLIGFPTGTETTTSLCNALINTSWKWSAYTQHPPVCRIFQSSDQVSIQINKLKAQSIGHLITLTNDADHNQYKLHIYPLKTQDTTEPEKLGWEIKIGPQALPALHKILEKYAFFDSHIDQFKKSLMDISIAAAPSQSQLQKVDDTTYLRKKNNQYLNFKEAYQEYLAESKSNKNYLAAGLEIAAILGLATGNYYRLPSKQNPNNVDWEYHSASEAFTNRLNSHALRFDDNAFDINVGHYYAGVGYYLAARTSGLSRWESLLTAGVASSFWEYVSEFKEVVSINDQINTTFGGAIIGETTWQMCKIFQVAKASTINNTLRGFCQAPRKMSSWLQEKITNKESAPEDLNIHPDIWAKLDLSLGAATNQQQEKSYTLGLTGEVIAIPLFEEPGRVKELLTGETVSSQMKLEASLRGDMSVFRLFTKTVLAAYYDKNLGRNRHGDLEGYNLFIGPSAALEIDEATYGSDEKNPRNDFRGIVHILGGTLDMVMYHNGYRLRATLDIYGDFAMIRSYAFEQYKKSNGTDGITSLLANEGYYYGLGATEKMAVTVEKGPLSIGASISQTNITSIERAERDYQQKTRTLNPSDSILTTKTWLVYELNKSWKAELGMELKRRKGSINQSSDVTSKDIIKYGKLIYQYH